MNETATVNERRADTRYEGVYAEYQLISSFDEKSPPRFKTGFIRNFSRSGLSLFISEDLELNSYFRIRLYDPNSPNPIIALAGIVWKQKTKFRQMDGSEHCNIGLKFMKIEKEDDRRLNMLVDYFESMKNRKYNILEHI